MKPSTPEPQTTTFAELEQIHQLAVQIARVLPDEIREVLRLADAQDALTMTILEDPGSERRVVAGYAFEGEDGGVTSGQICSFDCPAAVRNGLRLETFRGSLVRAC